MPLHFERRVRDLVHGYVYLTRTERRVTDHLLFQRLRHIRQNDVAFLVYPSLNVSRFEHSLGCCHVAGRIAATLQHLSPQYLKSLLINEHGFEQLCRLYALLHDVGHLPLSHLFEVGWNEFALGLKRWPAKRASLELCKQWFGTDNFSKPHEALGSLVAKCILGEIPLDTDNGYTETVRDLVLRLMSEKHLPSDDALWPVKWIVDSEIDADRIDSTARDGRLAGGEYGSYDIERLCSAFTVWLDNGRWRLGYSPRAITSLEGLLLDRYRTHAFIHFHHSVVALKCAVRLLVAKLLRDNGSLMKESLVKEQSGVISVNPEAWHVDDHWIWGKFREHMPDWQGEPEASALASVLFRDKSRFIVLLKSRGEWSRTIEKLRNDSGLRKDLDLDDFDRDYEDFLREKMQGADGVFLTIHPCGFKPLGGLMLPLCEGHEKQEEDLLRVSPLASSLNRVWKEEPQLYPIAFGHFAVDGKESMPYPKN